MLALGIAGACVAIYSAVRRKRVQKQCTVPPTEAQRYSKGGGPAKFPQTSVLSPLSDEVRQPIRQSFDEIVRETLDEWLDGAGDLSLMVLEFCTVDETKIDKIAAD